MKKHIIKQYDWINGGGEHTLEELEPRDVAFAAEMRRSGWSKKCAGMEMPTDMVRGFLDRVINGDVTYFRSRKELNLWRACGHHYYNFVGELGEDAFAD